MNKANLKSYAPQARKDFIAAVTARANLLGLSDQAGRLQIAPAQTQGDVTLIEGQAWPAKIDAQRKQLITRIQKDGFAQTIEAIAYTWFNRFAALRYMEIHDYLGHGHRALSSTSGTLPDILTHATDLTNNLPGLSTAKVTELKLAGNRDGELYRMLLVAQCNALSRAMPFLFERIDDDSELLLPDNLLRSDSVIAKLVAEIPEEDWAEVEIIGWLYQFYISEKKDQVIGKVVKSEDIPAATQLFTPNWIVQYLVQNSVGRLWLMANPQSTLAKEWPYYITPAEQTPEVQAQLDALIQTRVREDGDTLNPESITVLDPACGSGHILVVAYDVLKAIYLERGYRLRDIPRLILEKNLYGLDIDDRAAQLAGFALLMKARADDRRLLADPANPPKLNVLSLQESRALNVDDAATHLAPFGVQRATVRALADAFEHAKTFGSLIQIPYTLKSHLNALAGVLELVQQGGDLYAQAAAQALRPLVRQAQVLAMQFDAVVANPPYMGGKYLTPTLKTYLKAEYAGYEKDLFSAFMIRDLSLAKPSGQLGFMSPFVWMFISSYEELRTHFIDHATLTSLVQLEYSGFDGATVPICTFTLGKQHVAQFVGSYVRLSDFRGADLQGPKTLEAIQNKNCGWFYTAKPDDFKKIPGSPVAYWVSPGVRDAFRINRSLGQLADLKQGMSTTDAEKFVRLWFEIDFKKFNHPELFDQAKQSSSIYWYPFNKGGNFKKWYGNNEYIVRYENDGAKLLELVRNKYPNISDPEFVIKNRKRYFLESVTYSAISSSKFGVRLMPRGFIFSIAGPVIQSEQLSNEVILAFLLSPIATEMVQAVSPTLNFQAVDLEKLPIHESLIRSTEIRKNIELCTEAVLKIAKLDWNEFETSWDFQGNSLHINSSASLKNDWESWGKLSELRIRQTQDLEFEINCFLLDSYNLTDEFSAKVPEDQITLTRADREKDCQRLISYAIGCMMGRYSLDAPGLIYAHAGNVGFDPSRYRTFAADADGILPVTDEHWFADDAPERIREFLLAVWGPDTLEENMAWLAESLGAKAADTPAETIRRYIADKFFKDHLQTYKKRPIYWLFSSGKQGAFQALVYLHRYNESTLARMRAEYVVPLTGKILSRIEMLEKDAAVASSTSARNKLNKEVEKLKKKHIELLAYDEKLRHYADMRITLDLDDGVKVNYGKFGDLLAGVKMVTGGAGDD